MWTAIKRLPFYETEVESVCDGGNVFLGNKMVAYTDGDGTYTLLGSTDEDKVIVVHEGDPMYAFGKIIRGRGDFYVEPGGGSTIGSVLLFHHDSQETFEGLVLREKEASTMFLDHPMSALERMR